jgi:cytochrome c
MIDLATNLNEPMELDFLDADRIIFIERRGVVKVHHLHEDKTVVIGKIPVNYINESGLLGIAVDPNYSANEWVYFFYTDQVRRSYQNISRFKVRNDSLILGSEQRLLDFYFDYEHCCHNGGGLKFGPDGLLYISTGDNVGGTDFGPIDERPGHHLQDAQRSSANTMDYRGKILRIQPLEDGTYAIPPGNLFSPDEPKALPEIYVMGVRNPWKINVDQKYGWLHWGEVGPNPGKHDTLRGPVAHEEFNLAKAAGNFGWPYFVANNLAYADYDYARDHIGNDFDPDSLVNDSPNNTGLLHLPPAEKATIWYPNSSSALYPLLGQGGGSAVGGPIYHKEFYKDSKTSFPRYYENAWFIADWMRGWVLAAIRDRSGKVLRIEEFLPSHPFKKPIELEFGPDGNLYVLDYGSNWYAQNEDAKLTRILYNYDNRPPVANLTVKQPISQVPANIEASAAGSWDPDRGGEVSYSWSLNGKMLEEKDSLINLNMNQAGIYELCVAVTDNDGMVDSACTQLKLGNSLPEVDFTMFQPNQSFFNPGNGGIGYQIQVTDLEDDQRTDKNDDDKRLRTDFRAIQEGISIAEVLKHSPFTDPYFDHLTGKKLLNGSDCNSCHDIDRESVGPSYTDIANRYSPDEKTLEYLVRKISVGGLGAWGNKAMTAHPQHTEEEIAQMVSYIMAINGEPVTYPLSHPSHLQLSDPKRPYLLSIQYEDRVVGSISSNRVTKQFLLRPHRIHATTYDLSYRVTAKPYNTTGGTYAEIMLNGSFLGFSQIDLTGIRAISLRLRSSSKWVGIEVYTDDIEGDPIGELKIDVPGVENRWILSEDDFFDIEVPIEESTGKSKLIFMFQSDRTEGDMIYFDICQVEWIEFLPI